MGIPYGQWTLFERRFIPILTVISWTFFTLRLIYKNKRNFFYKELSEEFVIDGLSESWFGFKKDLHDYQWRAFSENLVLMVGANIFFVLVSRMIQNPKTSIMFSLGFGFITLCVMYSTAIIFWVLECSLFFLIFKLYKKKWFFPSLVWGLALFFLYFNEHYEEDIKFTKISNSGFFKMLVKYLKKESLRSHSKMNWSNTFNFTIVRLLSFCLDGRESFIKEPSIIPKHKCKQCFQGMTCLRMRQEETQPFNRFDLSHFIAFLTYFPLYIAGPIITYNAWVSQIYKTQNTHSTQDLFKYILRTIMVMVFFEVFLHLIFSNSIITNKSNEKIWKSLSLGDLALFSFYELIFLWLKFTCIWRIPRAIALIHGIETPENMNRCVCNNYCFEGFWRSWHRSFNQWLIRYIFVPLGGSKYKLLNIWVIFGFVSIWHEFQLNLLIWGMGICAALMPEMIVKSLISTKFPFLYKTFWFKYLCAFAGCFYIMLMIIANLIGYGFGVNGFIHFFNQNSSWNFIFGYLIYCLFFMPLVLTMFIIRENEDEDKNY